MGLDSELRFAKATDVVIDDNGLIEIDRGDVICKSGNYYLFNLEPRIYYWREHRELHKAVYELYCRTAPEIIIPQSKFAVRFHLTAEDIQELMAIPNLIDPDDQVYFEDALELISRGFVVYYISDF